MNLQYRAIVSRERRDLPALLVRMALGIGEWPYRWAVAFRNRQFDRRAREIKECGVPVISIGNLTTGGTGKTPLVCYVAKLLRGFGWRVAIVSRGYGAMAGEDNDEAMELARVLPDVPQVQDADRVEAARIAVEELESQVVLMDDGFQHRRLHRDLDIVVVDATNPFGYDHLLPRGLLREPVGSLARANVVVLSRADMVDVDSRNDIRREVARHAPNATWCEAIHSPVALIVWPDQKLPLGSIAGKRVAVVSAIGNPDAFADTVRRCGASIVAAKSLPDHDPYSSDTVASIGRWLTELGDSELVLVCTQKDLVKLQTDRLAGHLVTAIEVELKFILGEVDLIDQVQSVLAAMPRDDAE